MKLIENDTHYFIKGESVCSSCAGTGLYQGIAERDGARVICRSCEGSGKINIDLTYEKFITRKIDKKATRVFSNSMGYVITDKDIITDSGAFMPFSKYGCSYLDWQHGAKPKPLEFLGCPYQETNQSLQTEDKNNLYKSRCKEHLPFGGYISSCKLYSEKKRCWEIFNKD